MLRILLYLVSIITANVVTAACAITFGMFIIPMGTLYAHRGNLYLPEIWYRIIRPRKDLYMHRHCTYFICMCIIFIRRYVTDCVCFRFILRGRRNSGYGNLYPFKAPDELKAFKGRDRWRIFRFSDICRDWPKSSGCQYIAMGKQYPLRLIGQIIVKMGGVGYLGQDVPFEEQLDIVGHDLDRAVLRGDRRGFHHLRR